MKKKKETEFIAIVEPCTKCDGSGQFYVQSHGCWGEDESYYRTCNACNKGWVVKEVKGE